MFVSVKLLSAVLIGGCLLAFPCGLLAQTTYAATTRGASCRQNMEGSRLCTYRVGESLEISIAAVGEPDTGISFLRSDIRGDFYARFGVRHGCIIVAAGESAPAEARQPPDDLAFISPRTGLVYRTWQECSRAQ